MKTKNRNKPVLIPCHSVCSVVKNRLLPAQRHSKMTKLWMYPMGLIGHIGLMGKENHPVEPHSKFSNGRLSGRFCWPQGQDKNSPAQPHSKFSNGRLSGLFCWPQGQDINTSSAPPHSNISKFRNRPLSPSCLFSPLAFKNTLVEEDSKISKSGLSPSSPFRPLRPFKTVGLLVAGHYGL